MGWSCEGLRVARGVTPGWINRALLGLGNLMCSKRLFDLLHERGILKNIQSFLNLLPIFCPDDHKVFIAFTGYS